MMPVRAVALGPEWTERELRTFYILLRAHGTQWERFTERLPCRTTTMVRSLYDMHRGYLSLPEASADGFCAIMMDHYKMLEEMRQNIHGLEANHEPAKAENAQQRENHSNTPGRRKRKLEKLLGQGLLSAQVEKKKTSTSVYSNRMIERPKADQTAAIVHQKRHRKSIAHRAYQVLSHGSCAPMMHMRRFKLPWHDWFYSYVDVDFFQHSEFLECLDRIGLSKITKAARPVWSSVRASMGRPRRLSPRFFAHEKRKLEAYRSVKRSLEATSTVPPTSWPYRCPIPMRNGAFAIAYVHEIQGFILGIVAALDSSAGSCTIAAEDSHGFVCHFMCTFDDVMLIDEKYTTVLNLWQQSEENIPKVAHAMIPQVKGYPLQEETSISRPKVSAMMVLKDLLRRKAQIVASMKKVNDEAEEMIKNSEQGRWKSMGWKEVLRLRAEWLAQNLEVTNRHVTAALLHMQQQTAASELRATNLLTQPYEGEISELPPQQLQQVMEFLSSIESQSQDVIKRVELMPAATQLQPELVGLIASCITLSCAVTESQELEPSIRKRLLLHMLEALQPRFPSNHDVFNQIHSCIATLTE